MTEPISFEFVKAALTSPHTTILLSGQNTHDAALQYVAQLVPHTQDVVFVREIVAALLPVGYRGDTLNEVPGMVESAVAKGFADKKGAASAKLSERALGIVLSQDIELFHDQQREPYLNLPLPGGGKRAFPVRSSTVSQFIRAQYYHAHGSPLPGQSLAEVRGGPGF